MRTAAFLLAWYFAIAANSGAWRLGPFVDENRCKAVRDSWAVPNYSARQVSICWYSPRD